ncbi:MAG: ABC transporter permease, partial [Halobacteriales archaeon]
MSVDIGTDSETGLLPDELAGEERSYRRLLRGGLGTAAFLVVWHVAALFQPVFLLPSPVEVGAAFVVELTAPDTFVVPVTGTELALTRLPVKLIQSLYHYIPGLFIGGAAGIASGIALGWSPALDDAFTPVTRVLRPIPPLAWIAFAIVWLGVNHTGAAFIVAIGAFWINFYNAY